MAKEVSAMEPRIADWKFGVGDMVYFRCATHIADRTPKRFVVVSRIAEECSGGVQLSYCLGDVERRVHECELCADMPPYQPADEGMIADMMRIEDARSRGSWERVMRRRESQGEGGQ